MVSSGIIASSLKFVPRPTALNPDLLRTTHRASLERHCMNAVTKAAIDKFLLDSSTVPRISQWIDTNELHLYIRKSKRFLEGRWVTVIDIASITVAKPGKGYFKNLLAYLQKSCLDNGLYIESVVNPDLYKFLQRLTLEDTCWILRDDGFFWLKKD